MWKYIFVTELRTPYDASCVEVNKNVNTPTVKEKRIPKEIDANTKKRREERIED